MTELKPPSITNSWLWIVIALLASITVSSLLQLPVRQAIFAVALATGAVVLYQLNVRPQERLKRPLYRLPAGQTEVVPTLVAPIVKPTVIAADEPLVGEAAREWLDEFLVRQQQK